MASSQKSTSTKTKTKQRSPPNEPAAGPPATPTRSNSHNHQPSYSTCTCGTRSSSQRPVEQNLFQMEHYIYDDLLNDPYSQYSGMFYTDHLMNKDTDREQKYMDRASSNIQNFDQHFSR